ncbi:MAG: isoprenylcysteine carboxylmethyltransferase family protein [Muribaculaceae bacterium]|nr:isoprenylcysteine carboxylmethyltransferase family protein [Muribaculaceae bacterium]
MSTKGKLLLNAAIKGIMGCVIVALLIFIPAGTFDFNNGWLLMGILFIPMLIMGIVMWLWCPDLLRRRLDSKEKRNTQQGVVKFSGLLFIIGFVIAGLDYRLGWSSIPNWVSLCGAALFLIGYALYGEVMRENMWLSRTIHVEDDQKVVTTGLYSIVRHPMYTATLLMFLPVPIILGSWWAIPIFSLYIPIIIRRILDEESLLLNDLSGYTEYCNKLRWRLIPFVW